MTANGSERLLFAFFIALVAHALFIFGVRFSAPEVQREGFSLAVTLVHEAQAEPVDSNVRAAQNQAGSGDDQDPAQVRSEQLALWQAAEAQPVLTFMPQFSNHPGVRWVVITSQGLGDWGIAPRQDDPGMMAAQLGAAEPELSVASLQALLDHRRQSYTALPRVRTLTAMSAQQAPEADYVLAWQQRVQATGNANYPELARAQRLSGEVQLLSSLTPEGEVAAVVVLVSSGEPVLDAAAIDAVTAAGPFAPFTDRMRADYDVLEIIRTFRFDAGLQLGLAP